MMTKEEALLQVSELGLKPGDTVYTILRHAAKSGMMRRISLVVIKDNKPRQIDHIAAALGVANFKTVTRYDSRGSGYKDREEGLVMSGCGMDMGFALVYELGRALHPDGFDTEHGRNGDTSGRDNDGGYAFNHKWL